MGVASSSKLNSSRHNVLQTSVRSNKSFSKQSLESSQEQSDGVTSAENKLPQFSEPRCDSVKSDEEHKKRAVVTLVMEHDQKLAPIRIKVGQEEFMHYDNLKVVKDRLSENTPSHPLVLGRYFMAADLEPHWDRLGTCGEQYRAPNVRKMAGVHQIWAMGQPTVNGLYRMISKLRHDHDEVILLNVRSDPVLYVRQGRNDVTPRAYVTPSTNRASSSGGVAGDGGLTAAIKQSSPVDGPERFATPLTGSTLLYNSDALVADFYAYSPRCKQGPLDRISCDTHDELSLMELRLRKSIFTLLAAEDQDQFWFYDDLQNNAQPMCLTASCEDYLMVSEEVFSPWLLSSELNVAYARMPSDRSRPAESDVDTFIKSVTSLPSFWSSNESWRPGVIVTGREGVSDAWFGALIVSLLLAKRNGTFGELRRDYVINVNSPNYMMGEFDAVLRLIGILPNGTERKQQVDYIIDTCSTELFNLRLSINEYRKRLLDRTIDPPLTGQQLATMCHDHLEQYMFLILFNCYLHEQFDNKFALPFSKWLYSSVPAVLRVFGSIDSSHQTVPPSLLVTSERCLLADNYIGLDALGTQIDRKVSNFHSVPHVEVYGMAQPNFASLLQVTKHLLSKKGHSRLVWINLRQDAFIEVDGTTYNIRESGHLSTPLSAPDTTGAKLQQMENAIKSTLQQIAQELMVYTDIDGTSSKHRFKVINTPLDMYHELHKTFPYVQYHRVPINDHAAPTEQQFDQLTELIVKNLPLDDCNGNLTSAEGQASISAPKPAFLFNCRTGKGRTTTAMAICSLILFRLRGYSSSCRPGEEERVSLRDAEFSRGEFLCVNQLVRRLPNGRQRKREVDFVLDQCFEMMTTMHYHIREVIFVYCNKVRTLQKAQREAKIESNEQESASAACTDSSKAQSRDEHNCGIKHGNSTQLSQADYLRKRGLQFMERYMLLIVYNSYLHTVKPRDWNKTTFSTWMYKIATKAELFQHLDSLAFYEFGDQVQGASKLRYRWPLSQGQLPFRGIFI